MLRDMPLQEIFALLDLDELFRLQWGGRGSGPEYVRQLSEVFEPTLNRLTAQAAAEGWLEPGVYGYFPAQAEGNEMVSTIRRHSRPTAPAPRSRDSAFPGRTGATGSASPTTSPVRRSAGWRGGRDRPPGRHGRRRATRRFEKLQAVGEYTEAFYTHGLAVECAEALAEWMHRRHAARALARRADRQALLVGLRCLSGSRGSRAGLPAPARGRGAGDGSHARASSSCPEQSTAARSCSSPRGQVLRGSRGGEVTTGPAARSGARLRLRSATCITGRRLDRIPRGTHPGSRGHLLARLLDPESVVVFDGAMGTMLYAQGRLHQPVLR